MASLPRFPRPVEIAILPNGTRLQMSPVFARWLDQFTTETSILVDYVSLEELAPVSRGVATPQEIMPITRAVLRAETLPPVSKASPAERTLAPLARPCAAIKGLAPL